MNVRSLVICLTCRSTVSIALQICIALIVCLTGCSDKKATTSSSNGSVAGTSTHGPDYIDSQWPISGQNVPNPMPTREVYPIDEVGRLRDRRLNAAQIDWLKTIISTPYWRKRLALVYVSPLTDSGASPPIVVFYNRPGAGELFFKRSYQIIGGRCPTWFMLALDSYAFPMDPPGSGPETCFRDPLSPDSKDSTPLPRKPGSVSPARLLEKLDSMSTSHPPNSSTP
jgi:hypothetical protein